MLLVTSIGVRSEAPMRVPLSGTVKCLFQRLFAKNLLCHMQNKANLHKKAIIFILSFNGFWQLAVISIMLYR